MFAYYWFVRQGIPPKEVDEMDYMTMMTILFINQEVDKQQKHELDKQRRQSKQKWSNR